MTDDTAPETGLADIGAGEHVTFTARVVDGPASGLYVELKDGVRVRVTGVDADAWSAGDTVRVRGQVPCTESALVPGAHSLVMAHRVDAAHP